MKYCALLVALLASEAIAAPEPVSATASAASAAAANAPAAALEARTREELVYPFVVLPRRLILTEMQVEAVKEAAIGQVKSFHDSQAEGNRVAAAEHRRKLENWARSDEHDQRLRLHALGVLEAQHRNSQTIFHVVLSIVFIALALTAYQFIRDSALAQRVAVAFLRSHGRGQPKLSSSSSTVEQPVVQLAQTEQSIPVAPVPLSDNAISAVAKLTAEHPESKEALLALLKELRPSSSVVLGPTGLQLGSQIVGLVVLAFSLAFFYLYLSTVYPVDVHQLSRATPMPPAAPAASAPKK